VKELVVATALFVTVMSLEALRVTTKIFLGVRKPMRHSNLCPVFLEIHNILFQPHIDDQYEYTLIRSRVSRVLQYINLDEIHLLILRFNLPSDRRKDITSPAIIN